MLVDASAYRSRPNAQKAAPHVYSLSHCRTSRGHPKKKRKFRKSTSTSLLLCFRPCKPVTHYELLSDAMVHRKIGNDMKERALKRENYSVVKYRPNFPGNSQCSIHSLKNLHVSQARIEVRSRWWSGGQS